MLSRRAPSIQSAMSRRRFEEYSVTEPSISKCYCISSSRLIIRLRRSLTYSAVPCMLTYLLFDHYSLLRSCRPEKTLQARHCGATRDPQVPEIYRPFAAQAPLCTPSQGDRQRLCHVLRAWRIRLGPALAELRHFGATRGHRSFSSTSLRRRVSAYMGLSSSQLVDVY